MTTDNLKWLEKIKKKYIGRAENVLDVGSRNINGEARTIFTDCLTFTGIDYVAGEGVDIVMRGDALMEKWPEAVFDVVVCMNTLEHDDNFWMTLLNMRGVLRRGGYLIIVTPTFGFPIHRHPKDYWRFGEDAYREVFFDPKGWELLELEEQFTKVIDGKGVNPCLCAIGRKL